MPKAHFLAYIIMGRVMKEYKRLFADINLEHLEHNTDALHGLVKGKSKIMAVVKADAYGHGAVQLAAFLEQKDYIYGYAAATIEEAAELRRHQIKKPILILGYTFPEDYDKLAEYDIMPSVFREDCLDALSKAAQKAGRTIRVHIKVDTGMGRIGIAPDETGLSFIRKLLETKGLRIEGIFTHFARADEADKTHAKRQLECFEHFVSRAEAAFSIQIPFQHCANSAALMELPESHLDLVRAGIAMYGVLPSDQMKRELPDLKQVMSLHSHIVYIKHVKKGTPIGYGGAFTADKDMKIATIPAGYADGYPRSASGKGYVLIHGKKASVLGRVCMDQLMADVTDIPEALEGNLVTLIGKNGEEEISIDQLSAWSGRFHYELICDIGKRVPRRYIYHDEVIAIKDFYI